jgi:hypothetical protein
VTRTPRSPERRRRGKLLDGGVEPRQTSAGDRCTGSNRTRGTLWVAEASTAVRTATFRLLSGPETTEERVLARYETTDTGRYEFAQRVGIPPEFPIGVRNEWYEFDVTGTRTELEPLRDALDTSALSYGLISLVHTDGTETILTGWQRLLLSAVVTCGFRYPKTSNVFR